MMTESQVIEKLTKFKDVLSEYKQLNTQLKEQVVSLIEENTRLKELYESVSSLNEDNVSQLHEDVAKLNKTIETLKEENKQLTDTIKKDELLLEAANNEIQQLKSTAVDDSKIAQLTTDVEKIVSSNVLSEAEKRYEELTKHNTEIETKKYRFGRTSEAVMKQFKSFLDDLFLDAKKDNDVWILNEIQSDTDSHMLDAFFNRLNAIKYKGKKLIFKNQNGDLVSPFDKKFVTKYLFEEEPT